MRLRNRRGGKGETTSWIITPPSFSRRETARFWQRVFGGSHAIRSVDPRHTPFRHSVYGGRVAAERMRAFG